MDFSYPEKMEKGSSSSSSSGGDGSDSINGLNFGKKIYFGGGVSGLRPVAAPSTSPAKKGRTGAQPPRCQVEGCTTDLSDAKAYYCRHKVCSVHSKSPRVFVAGLEQRFCQQCSKFHQLLEFDQGKRSCRRRLDGHNKRRRKPPPGPLLPFRYGTLSPSTFDNHSRGGGLVMDFSSYSLSTNGRDSWPNKSSERGVENQSAILQKPSSSHDPLPNLLPKPNPHPEISPEGCFNSHHGALSLLSNTSWVPMGQPNDFLGPTHPSACISPFPWGFKGNQGGGLLHEMAPDMGLAAFSESSNSQFCGGLGLAQSINEHYHIDIEQSRGYDTPVHHMQRSL